MQPITYAADKPAKNKTPTPHEEVYLAIDDAMVRTDAEERTGGRVPVTTAELRKTREKARQLAINDAQHRDDRKDLQHELEAAYGVMDGMRAEAIRAAQMRARIFISGITLGMALASAALVIAGAAL